MMLASSTATATALVQQAQSLPALVTRAAETLANARTAAEVLEAGEMASFAYDVAKMRAKRLWAAHLRQSFRIDWKSGTPRQLFAAHAQWDAAVQRAADGDTEQLIALLRSDTPLHRDARDLIGELLVCRQMKRKPGRQARPGRISLTEGKLNEQVALFRYWRRKGLGHDEAVQAALRTFKGDQIEMRGERRPADDDLDEMVTSAEVERLENRLLGKRGTTRRMTQRRSG